MKEKRGRETTNIEEQDEKARSKETPNFGERYVNVESIGTGANGAVFKAFDKKLNRYVAIKRIGREEEWAWKEAEVLKKLKHLSIPVIYDVLKEEENVSIVMEYMEGNNLLSVLEEGEVFEEKRAVEIGVRIGECLNYLHSLPEKVIYRDLKPANLLIDSKDRIKLIDFDSAFVGRETERTVVHSGTFGYSAPEQFAAQGIVDEKSDIYGFGTTLYHMLTGKNPSRPPYRIYKIRELNPFISEGLERIVEKCMEQDREKRYKNMEEVLAELRNYDKKTKQRRRISRKKRYMVEETKNVFLTSKRCGGLFVLVVFLLGFQLFGKDSIFKERAYFIPQTIYAKEAQSETEVLPLILYNMKREKIIVKDGTFYETDGDFHMALPFKAFEGKSGVEVTVICKDLENGNCMQKEVLIKSK